ncbi:hypothetical protein [Clostridium perfringens]|uniref:hypothetical protein n=1 Tax=Clostridium perfringens TaxID=1502 RepID=UPI0024439217|nr:hypothetical protein [Clostridium perfringens]MDG6891180.1 hypothetical protein [Clostridium perfringens]
MGRNSWFVKGNDKSSAFTRKGLEDKAKLGKERDREIEQISEENKSEFIELFQYEDREYEIIKKRNRYYAKWSSIVIGDKDIDTLKKIKIPKYKDVKPY